MVKLRKIPQRIQCIWDDQADYYHKLRADPVHGKPIILTGSTRSGTTVIAELLNNNSVCYYHEPFLRHTILWNKQHAASHDTLPADMEKVRSTWQAIQEQRAWSFYRKSDRRYPYITKFAPHRRLRLSKRRILAKDPSLVYWLDDFITMAGDVHPVLIYRDPKSIVASLKRLNWDPLERLQTMYQHPYFSRYAIKAPDRDIVKMQPIERMALQTALFHFFLRTQQALIPEATVIHFEQLLANPAETVPRLAKVLELPDDLITQDHIRRITASDKKVTYKHEYQRNAQTHLQLWSQGLSEEECARVDAIYLMYNPKYNSNL